MDPLLAARQRWPDVTLEPAQFRAWLEERKIDPQALDAERLASLFLACACVLNAPGAHLAFDASFGPVLTSAAKRVRDAPSPEEVVQQVRMRLLTSTPQRGAKLAEYSGAGDFTNWLRTVTLRVALSMRSSKPLDEVGEAALTRIVSAMPDAERLLQKAQNATLIKTAFADALAQLEPQQRTVLKMSVIDGLSIDQIAPFYSVHRATVARWLETVRRDLYELTLEALQHDAGLSPSELKSLLGDLGSQLNVSLDRLLVTRD